MAPLGRVIDPLLESALVVRHGFCATAEPHFGAEVITAALTRPAVVARYANFERHSVIDSETRYLLANSDNNTSRFMAKREGSGNLQVTVAILVVVGNVAAADPGRLDLDLELVRARGVDGPGFLQRSRVSLGDTGTLGAVR